MAAPPWKSPLTIQFSLRFLLSTTTLVALFFALRRGYLMSAFSLDEAIERARNVPTLLAIATALLVAMFPRSPSQLGWSAAMRGALLCAAVGLVSCLALAIEFGEALRQMNYWDWRRDWPLVVPYLIVATVQGGAIGAFVLQLRIPKLRRARRFPSQLC